MGFAQKIAGGAGVIEPKRAQSLIAAARPLMWLTMLMLAVCLCPHAEAKEGRWGPGVPDAPWLDTWVAGRVVATASPDSTFRNLVNLIGSARQSIHMSVYQLDNPFIGDALLEALEKNRVELIIAFEGRTIPRLSESELYIADKLAKKGAKIFFYDTAERSDRTFKYLHAKYTIVDGKRVAVGSANYGMSGHPRDTSFGNREWEVVLDDRHAAELFEKAFDHDLRLKGEWVAYGTADRYRCDGCAEPAREVKSGEYHPRGMVEAFNVATKTVFAPDNSLNDRYPNGKAYDGPIFKTLAAAKESVLIQQLNFETYWGLKQYNPDCEESPLIETVLELARAGRQVRILLNDERVFMPAQAQAPVQFEGQEEDRGPGLDLLRRLGAAEPFTGGLPLRQVSYADQAGKGADACKKRSKERDNNATVSYLSQVARKEGLNLQVKLLNYKNCSMKVLHNKGFVVDGKFVLVGSLNWGESALKFNREAGVLLKSPEIGQYYSQLFDADWSCSSARR